ncbi:MAG: hypothetical protein AAGI27_08900 [Pseudomonadota bacterium]
MNPLELLLLSLAATTVTGEPDPLFQSDEILDIELTAPFAEIMKTRSVDEETTGTLGYVDDSGEVVTLGVKLRARGNFRRNPKVCAFTPLRLNFAKKDVEDTLFHKQDKLKLVTHCKTRDKRYEQGVIREYLAYRFFNEITDLSFRVRLLRVTYVDPDNAWMSGVAHGILIEHKDRLAKRTGLTATEGVGRIKTRQLDLEHTALSSVFHYLIGNTDFSPISSNDPTDCCHNHALFDTADGKYVSIPYDFDMSGFINAPYAKPNSRFNLRSVTVRLYRGRCRHNAQMESAITRYQETRDVFAALLAEQEQLEKRARRELVRYVNEFYKTIDDPKRLENRLIDQCL